MTSHDETTAGDADEFTADADPLEEIETVGPPAPLLGLAVACVAVSAALLLVPGLPAAIAGYLLASVVAIVLVGLFRREDLRRRQLPFYAAHPAMVRGAVFVVAAGLAITVLHTWTIATELAK